MVRQHVSNLNLPPSLRRLTRRQGRGPRVDFRYPCFQIDELSPAEIRERLLKHVQTLEGVELQATTLSVPGASALVLCERLARGQPEAFIRGREFALVRRDGSAHLSLPPAWGQKVLDRGWATIHPLVRYLAGALPPQSLLLYAPRDQKELVVAWKIVQAAYCFARGEIEGHPLPDSAW
jgi:hypothetical protein